LEKIKKISLLGDNLYLAGGTALAIELGHRKSIDLDFFSRSDFSTDEFKKKLSGIGTLEVTNEEDGTLDVLLDGVKVSFLRYGYGQLFPFLNFEGIKLADERDIGAMKIDAVSSRGSKKDFIDIYFLLKKYDLGQLLAFFEEKYENIKYNKIHILKSLVYFDDAENEPMPLMIEDVKWEDVRKKIEESVIEMEKNL